MEQVVVSVELVTKEVVRVQGKVEREVRLVVGVLAVVGGRSGWRDHGMAGECLPASPPGVVRARWRGQW